MWVRLNVGEEGVEPEILLDDVRQPMSCLKNGKSQAVKKHYSRTDLISWRKWRMLCNIIWRTRQWPEEWPKVVFIFLPKSGDLKDNKNYQNPMSRKRDNIDHRPQYKRAAIKKINAR